MAFIATVTITADTDTTRLVTDPEPRGFEISLFDVNGSPVDVKTGTELTHEFAGLSAGTYSVTAVLKDVAGTAIGGTARAEFTITDDPIDTLTVKTVSGLGVSVAKAGAAPAPTPSTPAAPGV